MTRRIAIVGAGIVGSALASELSRREGIDISVFERASERRMPGSTGHAPGFVGVHHENPALVDLAVRSVERYAAYPAFAQTGGWEIATTESGAVALGQRAEAARAHGLPVRESSVSEAVADAPLLVDTQRALTAWRYDRDGRVDAVALTRAMRAEAARAGARLHFDADVRAVQRHGATWRVEVDADAGPAQFVVDDVVFAGGVWGGVLSRLVGGDLPIFPVGHPLVWSEPREGSIDGPLVRYRDDGIYTRIDRGRILVGTYAHDVLDAPEAAGSSTADLDWNGPAFDTGIRAAIAHLPEASRFEPDIRVNGAYAMTPDGLPLIGPIGSASGLWSVQAVWVTHAGGAAEVAARMIVDDGHGASAFMTDRFSALSYDEAKTISLSLA